MGELGQKLFDPDANYAQVDPASAFTANGSAVIGDDSSKPLVVVATNGGSDLIYLREGDNETLKKVISILSSQDYTSGLFVDDAFGSLPMSALGLKGAAVTPQPSIVISFATSDTGCEIPTACGIEIADSSLQQGQGMHGSFSRADTKNTMAAIGPDFQRRFIDPAPASNADFGLTIAHILQLDIAARGKLAGRVLSEAMGDMTIPKYSHHRLRSEPDANGNITQLNYQVVGDAYYFDAAGYPGRTLGLK